jgi:membrane-associated protease RseP (regulator of RpoE activity)
MTNHPREKRIKTAFHLALYSLALALTAVASLYYPPAILAAALIAPFGHEFLIKIGNAAEIAAPSIFRSDRDGLQVMAVIPGSTAQRAGLRAGDRLLAINGYRLHSEPEFRQLLSLARGGSTFAKVSRGNGERGDNGGERELVLPLAPVATGPEQAPYGLIFSPGPDTSVYVELKHSSLLHKWRRRRQEG